MEKQLSGVFRKVFEGDNLKFSVTTRRSLFVTVMRKRDDDVRFEIAGREHSAVRIPKNPDCCSEY